MRVSFFHFVSFFGRSFVFSGLFTTSENAYARGFGLGELGVVLDGWCQERSQKWIHKWSEKVVREEVFVRRASGTGKARPLEVF